MTEVKKEFVIPEGKRNIVFDNGSFFIRAGYSFEQAPEFEIRSVLGTSKDGKTTFVGSDAQENQEVASIRHPIQQGKVSNWDDLERLWTHAYTLMEKHPEEHNVVMTDAPLNPAINRQKMAQVMFEKLNVPKLYIAMQGVMSLYACGLKSGIALDIGHDVTQVVPINDGFPIHQQIKQVPSAGRQLTLYLQKIINEAEGPAKAFATEEFCRAMKEDICGFPDGPGGDSDVKYTLPDGQEITVGKERQQVPDTLFKPSLLGAGSGQGEGIHQMVHNTIQSCDANLHETLYNNIALTGGSTLFKGFQARFESEFAPLVPQGVTPKFYCKEKREQYVWIGATILASLPAIDTMWLTKSEYEEHGPSIVNKKTF